VKVAAAIAPNIQLMNIYKQRVTQVYKCTYAGLLLAILCFCAFFATACATLSPVFETPTVKVTSFTPLPSQNLTPSFEIGIRVVNPNTVKLNLRGMSYKLFLNDYEVLDGVANALPVVPAYGEAEIKLTATVGLVEGMRFVSDMLQSSHTEVTYRLQANLDVGALIPIIRIEKAGSYAP